MQLHGLGHSLGHSLCIGVGYLISFVIETVFLWNKKKNHELDPNDKKNNKTIFWDLWKRSLCANFAAFVGVAIAGAAIAILGVMTGGIGCIVAIIVCIVVGSGIKWAVKRFWDRQQRLFYGAIVTFKFRNCHRTYTMQELNARYNHLQQSAKDDMDDENERIYYLRDLAWANAVLVAYLRIRDQDNGLLASKIEAYKSEKEKSCIIM